MLEKLDSGSFRITVNVRECFLYTVDFKLQHIDFVYINRTDDYTFCQTFEFKKFCGKDWIYKDSLYDVIDLVTKSIDYYLNNNIISASVRRAWIKFKDEYCSALNGVVMLKLKI